MSEPDRLLREYVRHILNEDDGGAIAGDLMSGAVDAMPYGMSYGSGSDLYKVFVEPFVDVFRVAKGKTKELSVKAQTLGKTALKYAATSIMPSIADDYERIFADEKKKLEKIKREYKPVYDRVWEAFAHEDLKVLAFFYDPFAAGALLSYFGGKEATRAALDVVNALSGGMLDHLLVRGEKRRSPVQSGVGGDVDEGVIRESDDKKNLGSAVKKALKSDSARKLADMTQGIVQTSLNTVVNRAKMVSNAKTLGDLTKAGFDVPREAMAQVEKVPQEERGGLEAALLQGVKKSAIEFYAKNLEGQLRRALDSGVPRSSQYVKDYEKAVATVKSLA